MLTFCHFVLGSLRTLDGITLAQDTTNLRYVRYESTSNMKKIFSKLAVAVMALLPILAFANAGLDTFDTQPSANGWVTDRYSPNVVESTTFDGDMRLHFVIDPSDSQANRPGAYSGSFYNTQGIQKQTAVSGDWTVKGQFYVSDAMLTGTEAWRSGLWARTGIAGDESTADYAILDLAMFDPLNPFGGLAMSLMLRVFDSNVGWVNLDSSLIKTGWNDLQIDGSTSGFAYGFNGTQVHLDNVVQMPTSLTTTFVNSYNFGGPKQDQYWDNVSAEASSKVPDTSSTLGLMALAIGSFGVFRSSLKQQFA